MKKLLLLSLIITFNAYGTEKTVLIADPKVLAVPIHENHERLIDLKHQKLIAYGPSPLMPNNPYYTKMRKTIYNKLKKAQTLLPPGLKFCIYEGYRSLNLQQKIF